MRASLLFHVPFVAHYPTYICWGFTFTDYLNSRSSSKVVASVDTSSDPHQLDPSSLSDSLGRSIASADTSSDPHQLDPSSLLDSLGGPRF